MTGLVSDREKPRVLVLASTYPRWKGDPEPCFVHELAKRLTSRFEVLVLGPHAPGTRCFENMDGVQVVRYRYAPAPLETLVNDGGIVTNLRRAKWKFLLVPSFVLMQIWAAWRLMRRYEVDVIHAHWLLPQGLTAALLQWISGGRVPFVSTSHGADLFALRGRVLDGLKRFVVGASRVTTVVSGAMRDELARLQVGIGKVEVRPMGVDMQARFTATVAKRSADRILFVGRLVEKKGLRILIEAMPSILEQYPRALLTIVGFGPEESALKAQMKALGLESAVEFVGAVPQSGLPELYRRAAVFVAPFVVASDGDREGLGLVTIEAIACGCPVVVGDVSAVREILDQPEDAWLRVPPGDPVALAVAVNRVLANPARTAELMRGIRERVAARFEWDQVASSYADLLSSSLPPERSAPT